MLEELCWYSAEREVLAFVQNHKPVREHSQRLANRDFWPLAQCLLTLAHVCIRCDTVFCTSSRTIRLTFSKWQSMWCACTDASISVGFAFLGSSHSWKWIRLNIFIWQVVQQAVATLYSSLLQRYIFVRWHNISLFLLVQYTHNFASQFVSARSSLNQFACVFIIEFALRALWVQDVDCVCRDFNERFSNHEHTQFVRLSKEHGHMFLSVPSFLIVHRESSFEDRWFHFWRFMILANDRLSFWFEMLNLRRDKLSFGRNLNVYALGSHQHHRTLCIYIYAYENLSFWQVGQK